MQLIIRIILGFVVGAAAGGLITYLYVTTSANLRYKKCWIMPKRKLLQS